MNLAQWCRLGEWHDSVREALAQLLPSGAPEANQETLQALRSRFIDALERLRSSLLAELSDRDVNRFLLPLVLLCDEKVLTRIRMADRRFWPLLQRELYNVENGGDLFYELVDEQLAPATSSVAMGEVLLFCLSDGFRGRFGDSPARLQGYRTRLAGQLGTSEEALPKAVADQEVLPEIAEALEPPSVLRRAVFYSVTAIAILAMPFLFVWLSGFFNVNG